MGLLSGNSGIYFLKKVNISGLLSGNSGIYFLKKVKID